MRHDSDDVPFALSAEEMSAKMLGELPPGFKALAADGALPDLLQHVAAVCRLVRGMFEQLYRAFTNYWTQRGFELSEPEFPLTAIVFADRPLPRVLAARVGGGCRRDHRLLQPGEQPHGALRPDGPRSPRHARQPETSAQIKRILAQPGAAPRCRRSCTRRRTRSRSTADCVRYSDCPLWFTEGIAVYFETPNLSSDRGWRTIGAINRPRLEQFQQYLRKRPADSLEKLIATDERLRDTKRDWTPTPRPGP